MRCARRDSSGVAPLLFERLTRQVSGHARICEEIINLACRDIGPTSMTKLEVFINK
jgi:hypothetical protein